MGVLLSKPNTDKEYDEGQNDKLAFAACSMQVGSCAFKRAHPFRIAPRPSPHKGVRTNVLFDCVSVQRIGLAHLDGGCALRGAGR